MQLSFRNVTAPKSQRLLPMILQSPLSEIVTRQFLRYDVSHSKYIHLNILLHKVSNLDIDFQYSIPNMDTFPYFQYDNSFLIESYLFIIMSIWSIQYGNISIFSNTILPTTHKRPILVELWVVL